MKIFSGLIILIILTSCALIEEPPANVSQSIPTAVLPGDNVLNHPDRVTLPAAAPWLTRKLNISYQEAKASFILQFIGKTYPIRLLFTPKKEVLITNPPGAYTIQDHLNALCNQADWSYTVTDQGVILINDIETKTIHIKTQPGNSQASANLYSLANSGASGSTNQLDLQIDPYELELETLLEAILGIESGSTDPATVAADGANSVIDPNKPDSRTKVAILPSANAVLVTAKPHKIREVERAIQNYNAATSKTIVVHITFFEVDVSNSVERSLNLNLLRAAAVGLGISVAPGAAVANASSLSLNINRGRGQGSQAIFNWLSTAGKTTITFDDTVEIRNNQIGSLNVTRTRQYVSSIAQAQNSQGNTTTSVPQVEFDTLLTGWALHIQPTAIDNTILVRLALSRSDLIRVNPYSFAGGMIAGTTFETADFNRMMVIRVGNGETRMLASLNTSENRSSNRRTPWLPGVADNKSKNNVSRETVMILSAEII